MEFTPIDVSRMNRRIPNGERVKSNMIHVTLQITEENKEIFNLTKIIINFFQLTVENKKHIMMFYNVIDARDSDTAK